MCSYEAHWLFLHQTIWPSICPGYLYCHHLHLFRPCQGGAVSIFIGQPSKVSAMEAQWFPHSRHRSKDDGSKQMLYKGKPRCSMFKTQKRQSQNFRPVGRNLELYFNPRLNLTNPLKKCMIWFRWGYATSLWNVLTSLTSRDTFFIMPDCWEPWSLWVSSAMAYLKNSKHDAEDSCTSQRCTSHWLYITAAMWELVMYPGMW